MNPLSEKKIIIVCNTLFQIMVAVQLRLTEYRNRNVDIVVSNHTNNGKAIADRVRQTQLFDRVFFVKNKKAVLYQTSFWGKASYTFRRCFEVLNNLFLLSKISMKGCYDTVAISNLSIFTILLFNRLLQKDRNTKLHIFEEGFSTYCNSYIEADKPTSLHRKFVNRKGMIAYVEKLLVFNKELVNWKIPNGQISEIPKFCLHNPDFKNAVNQIFDTASSTDKYDRKVIFFEESFDTDGFQVNDIELVNKISQIVGKENIMIKLHPRTKYNRFEKLGYKTNQNTNVPWEAIIINQDLTNKILVTISSGSVIYPYLYFDVRLKSYSLLNCMEHKPGYMNGELGIFMQKIYDSYPDVFYAPNTMEEFLLMLSGLLKKN